MISTRFASLMLATGIALSGSYSTAMAKDAKLSARINVTFANIGVGRLKSFVTLRGNAYTVEGNVRSKGIARMFSGFDATFSAKGVFAGPKLKPSQQYYDYTENKKSGKQMMRFSGTKVTSLSATPPVKYKSGAVKVTGAHKVNVLDPVSTLVVAVPAGQENNGRAVCNRTVPVFDGKTRFNLKLAYKSQRQQKTKGFRGSTYVCSARYQPIAGHRPNRKNVKYMVANKGIEITLARIGKTNKFGVFGFKVPLREGTVRGRATRWEVK